MVIDSRLSPRMTGLSEQYYPHTVILGESRDVVQLRRHFVMSGRLKCPPHRHPRRKPGIQRVRSPSVVIDSRLSPRMTGLK